MEVINLSTTSQMIFNITIIFITVAIVAGVVLGTIALFRIAHALKLRNRILQQTTRPYLVFQRNQQQLRLKNFGSIPVTIDQIESDFDFSNMLQQKVYGDQAYYFNLTNPDTLTISIKYHDDRNDYQDNFTL